MKTQDITQHLSVIDSSILWADKYNKANFPMSRLKEMRRQADKIHKAASYRCAAAAYGESQVGKSYLMSSLLSSPDQPFSIMNNGVEYSFIDDINPSGGNNSKVESTGLVTRFTSRPYPDTQKPGTVRAQMLTVVDILCLICDTYYNDLSISLDSQLTSEQINSRLLTLSAQWQGGKKQDILTENDLMEVKEYLEQVIGSAAVMINKSRFFATVIPMIDKIPVSSWADVMSLLWNENPDMTSLFRRLLTNSQNLGFAQEILLPFDALLRKNGTLLKIDWLDQACGLAKTLEPGEIPTTDIYSVDGEIIASAFNKSDISPLIAEISFPVNPSLVSQRPFLNDLDLLDFPGARSREKYEEKDVAQVLPQMLRRGKVAYLFNKYSRSLRIASVLFCHHNDQKSEPSIGQSISQWIDNNIGNSPEARMATLEKTQGISPFMFIATKFNIDLQRLKIDLPDQRDNLVKHWNRFDTVIPELVKPARWMDHWTSGSSEDNPFKSIYPLRDYYWSAKNGLMSGYSDGATKSPEQQRIIYPEYPAYWDDLRDSFVNHPFVRSHFSSPGQAWDEFTSPNKDGSQVIIRDLNHMAPLLQASREAHWQSILQESAKELSRILLPWHEPEDSESRNKKVRRIAGDLRLSLTGAIARDPAVFGNIMNTLMINVEPLREATFDILVRHTMQPHDYSVANIYRMQAGINTADPREENIQKLMDFATAGDRAELDDMLKDQGTSVDEIIQGDSESLSTVQGLLSHKLVEIWHEHLTNQTSALENLIPHANHITLMLQSVADMVNLTSRLAQTTARHLKLAGEEQQCNAIADSATSIFNDLVATVGQAYMSSQDLDSIKTKSQACNLRIDEPINPPESLDPISRIEQSLTLLEKQNELMSAQSINRAALSMLPFFCNYCNWQNMVIAGLLFCSDVSKCDPIANAEIQQLISLTNSLYHE